MKALNPASAIFGAAALALVLLTVSAAQQRVQLASGSVTILNLGELARKPVRLDVDLPVGQGAINTLVYAVPPGKRLVIEGYLGHADGSGFLMREPYSGGGLNAFWYLGVDVQASPAGSLGTAFGTPLIFRGGEFVYWNHINPGEVHRIHASFTGYLVDA